MPINHSILRARRRKDGDFLSCDVPWMLPGGHLQSILAGIYPRSYPRELPPPFSITLPVDQRAHLRVEITPNETACRLAVMFHGFTGNADSPVMLRALLEAHRRGYTVARVNLRNAGGTHELSEGLFTLLQWRDVGKVLLQLKAVYLTSRLYVIGFSVGGNLVLNQIAREKDVANLLDGVAAINPPIDIAMAAASVSMPRNRIYMRTFVRAMVETVRNKRRIGELYSDPTRPVVRNVPDFDRRYILPEIGVGSTDEYYELASSREHLNQISVPTLVLASRDDPIVPVSMFDGMNNITPSVRTMISDRGGHIGYFYRRDWQWKFWAAELAFDFFDCC